MTTNQLIDQLVTEGGAIVTSGECSEMEIADAQATGRFSVREDGIGFVRRYAEWLALQLEREEAGRDYAQDRTTESIMEKSRENAILAGDLLSENRKLRAALEDANGMCRSTMMIIERGGEANWAAFEERLRESLQRQHAVMHPGQNAIAVAPPTQDSNEETK